MERGQNNATVVVVCTWPWFESADRPTFIHHHRSRPFYVLVVSPESYCGIAIHPSQTNPDTRYCPVVYGPSRVLSRYTSVHSYGSLGVSVAEALNPVRVTQRVNKWRHPNPAHTRLTRDFAFHGRQTAISRQQSIADTHTALAGYNPRLLGCPAHSDVRGVAAATQYHVKPTPFLGHVLSEDFKSRWIVGSFQRFKAPRTDLPYIFPLSHRTGHGSLSLSFSLGV